MNCKSRFGLLGLGSLVAVVGSLAIAYGPADEDHPHQLPPGMSEADMQACIEAGTPGPMHAHLAEAVGTWNGKTQMWMAPGTEPMKSECVSIITALMDGRYIKCETTGEMPGMGLFVGNGLYGYDNVSEEFVSTWIDNHSTGIMTGTGKLSPDKKTMTWNYSFNCPITQGKANMREVEKRTGKDSYTLEMYMPDPATRKEFKMMQIDFTRKPGLASGSTTR